MLWKSHQAKAVPRGKLTVLAQFIKKEEEGLKSKELRIHLRKLEKEQEKKPYHTIFIFRRGNWLAGEARKTVHSLLTFL